MKTLLEVTPQVSRTYKIPDEIFDVFIETYRNLNYKRMRLFSMFTYFKTLSEFHPSIRKMIKIKEEVKKVRNIDLDGISCIHFSELT